VADFLIGFERWAIEVSALSTVLLSSACIARQLVRQPARRVILSRAVMLALFPLLVACAMPRLRVLPIHLLRGQPPDDERIPRSVDLSVPISAPPAIGASGANLDARQASPGIPEAEVWPRDRYSAGLNRFAALTLVVYAGISLVFAALFVVGAVRARRLCARAIGAPGAACDELAQIAGTRRLPQLLVSSEITTACAVGVVRPVILLPDPDAHAAVAGDIRAALTHEWSHIERNDLWMMLVLRNLSLVLYPQPLFWLLGRTLLRDQELVADSRAAARVGALNYAECLVAWARSASNGGRWRSLPALSALSRSSALRDRLARVLAPEPSETECPRRWRYVACMLVVVVAGLLCSVNLQASSDSGAIGPHPSTTRAAGAVPDRAVPQRLIPVTGRERISIRASNWKVRISTWDRKAVDVEITRHAGERPEKAFDEVAISKSKDLLEIRQRALQDGNATDSTRISVCSLRIPKDSTVESIETETGDVVADGPFGNIIIKTGSGGVRLGELGGDADISSNSGEIFVKLTNWHGGHVLRAHSGTGDLNVYFPRKNALAMSARSRDGVIEDAFGPARVSGHNSSLNRSLDGGKDGKLELSTESGTLAIRPSDNK